MSGNVQMHAELSRDYPLSSEQLASYRENGHLLLKDVASCAVIDHFGPLIRQEVIRLNTENRPLSERDTYGKAFLQIQNLWEKNEEIYRFVFARRFARIAAELMGVSGVRMYHDQALFKEPGGGHTPWHQDQIYWPVDTEHTITLWMPLVDIPEEVGSMTFASGSHKRGYISKLAISDQSHKTLAQYIEAEKLPTLSYGAMSAGDATFHAGWTLHSAPGNPTGRTREVMTIIYVADGTKVLTPETNARRADLVKWMPGLQPGDLIDSPLNPLMYSSPESV
ncbi:phytanoyl-CoA dioxygenase family protein [Paenibacillus montanisoli]|uniref:Phytanoyl-CoA dioxygenase family protein n=1 Tax=Paenibacillus montanisoli TaxID=2081970 RepID=A0A328TY79_9BACL|nr:phytanoyl-CoA dioxygenase family protein [Paenibacillus montanisoli]RAP75447.1 phytanoyl-CoA dioxygenase family protein [Paenibacillus montanisoli]